MLLFGQDIDGGTEVRLSQESLHEPAVQETRQLLAQLADASGGRRLRLDFAGVTELPAGALGALVAVWQRVEAAGGRLLLSNLAPELYEVLRVTRLDSILDVRPENSSCGVA